MCNDIGPTFEVAPLIDTFLTNMPHLPYVKIVMGKPINWRIWYQYVVNYFALIDSGNVGASFLEARFIST